MSNLSVNAIFKFLGIYFHENRATGLHPGAVMGAAPMAYGPGLPKQMRINQKCHQLNATFAFVSRAWVYVALCFCFIYQVLKMSQWKKSRTSVNGGSKTPKHPEFGERLRRMRQLVLLVEFLMATGFYQAERF